VTRRRSEFFFFSRADIRPIVLRKTEGKDGTLPATEEDDRSIAAGFAPSRSGDSLLDYA
jgi:hypothetical protein